MTDQTSELLYMRAKLRLPGGVNSPVRAYQAVGRTPRFIQSAKGSHITDVDGNEMIDYVCSWGPGILGHADSRVIEKVKAACDEGLTFGAPTEREVEMALRADASIIGVNNRDLKTFTVDINNSARYRKMVPKEVSFVSESGIKTAEDIAKLLENGTDAVLIGETLMRSENKKQALDELRGM